MKKRIPEAPGVILTVGHSNRKLDVFMRLLQSHVEHILSNKSRKPHSLTPWAVVNGTRTTYPPELGQSNPESEKDEVAI